jgi:glutamate transport system permease protein
VIDILTDNFGLYWRGFLVTVDLSLRSFAVAFVIGVVLAGFRVSPIPPLRRFAIAYVAFFRNTPLLALLFLLFFGVPGLGIQYSPFVTAVIGLGLYTGAYMAETVRSGINSVSKGQAEAARSVGLPFRQVLSSVVLPQAMRTVVPPIGNLFIANAKNTAIVLSIGVTDLTAVSQRLINNTGRPLEVIAGAAVFYVIYLLLATQAFALIEQRVAIKR